MLTTYFIGLFSKRKFVLLRNMLRNEDPTGKSDEEFRFVISEIEKRVIEFKERLLMNS